MYYFTGHSYQLDLGKIAYYKRLLYFPSLVGLQTAGDLSRPRGREKFAVTVFRIWVQEPGSKRRGFRKLLPNELPITGFMNPASEPVSKSDSRNLFSIVSQTRPE